MGRGTRLSAAAATVAIEEERGLRVGRITRAMQQQKFPACTYYVRGANSKRSKSHAWLGRLLVLFHRGLSDFSVCGVELWPKALGQNMGTGHWSHPAR